MASYPSDPEKKAFRRDPSRNNIPAGGRGKHGDARLCAWTAYTDGEWRPDEGSLPIVHVKEKRGGGFVQVAVGQQLLQLFHQVIFVRGA